MGQIDHIKASFKLYNYKSNSLLFFVTTPYYWEIYAYF